MVVMCVHGVPRKDLGREWKPCREVDGRGIVSRMGVALIACDSAPWCSQTPTAAATGLNKGHSVCSRIKVSGEQVDANGAPPST